MKVTDIFQTMDYGPVPVSADCAEEWLQRRDGAFGLYIGGSWVDAGSGESIAVHNPASGGHLATVAKGSEDEVGLAVAAAGEAHEHWRTIGGHARARYLYGLAQSIQKHAQLFAVLETLDTGQSVRASQDIELPLVTRHFDHHAGWAQLLERELEHHEPIGVVGQIIPLDAPLLALARYVAPALAAANTIVLIPAEQTPLTTLLFAEICDEVGLPPGVINIVTGDRRTAEALVEHSGVDMITSTGSIETAQRIRTLAAGSGKRLVLEPSGESPCIVLDDADLDSAVEGIVEAITTGQGGGESIGSRVLAQESIAERLNSRLASRIETLRIGDPLDLTTDVGASSSPERHEHTRRFIERGREEGATVRQPTTPLPKTGHFVPPTLLTDVSTSVSVAQEELSGPVIVVMTFRTPSEAIALVKNTASGHGASIWSESIEQALDTASRIEADTVWINGAHTFGATASPTRYRTNASSREAVWEYLRPAWEAACPVDEGAPPQEETSAPDPETAQGGLDTDAPDRSANQVAARHLESYAEPESLLSFDPAPRHLIGGRLLEPDSGESLPITDPQGRPIGSVAHGNRKDIDRAVESARGAAEWAQAAPHDRAQALYGLAANLAARAEELGDQIHSMTSETHEQAEREVALAIDRLYTYAAWADKSEGSTNTSIARQLELTVPGPIGVMGVLCPDTPPLLGFISTVGPALAMGNAIVVVPSRSAPLIATHLYSILHTSDLPDGVLNIVTGPMDELASALAAHEGIDGLWFFGTRRASERVEQIAAQRQLRLWTNHGRRRDWFHPLRGESDEFIHHATKIKRVWLPYGK